MHQRRALEKPPQEEEEKDAGQGDEDGPVSEAEEPADHLAEDSDPMSDGSGAEEADRAGLGRGAGPQQEHGSPARAQQQQEQQPEQQRARLRRLRLLLLGRSTKAISSDRGAACTP